MQCLCEVIKANLFLDAWQVPSDKASAQAVIKQSDTAYPSPPHRYHAKEESMWVSAQETYLLPAHQTQSAKGMTCRWGHGELTLPCSRDTLVSLPVPFTQGSQTQPGFHRMHDPRMLEPVPVAAGDLGCMQYPFLLVQDPHYIWCP